jgi:U4/U6 small nuclear ribonucleoprotein PRP4
MSASASRKARVDNDDDDGVALENLMEDVNYSMGGASSERARQENKAILDELERKKRARTMAVPTDDARVKARLREIGEPITLFGERAPDRRDRLKYVLSQIQAARGGEALEAESESSSEEEEEEEFYTPGTLELLAARQSIAMHSLPRAQKRIAHQREESRLPLTRIIDLRKRVFGYLKLFSNLGSQIGDDRPISLVRFSPNSKLLATGSWSGNVKLWDVPSCNLNTALLGHSDRVGGVAWHPEATLTQSADVVNIASGAADNTVKLWNLSSNKSMATLNGHQDRVCRVVFHPSGNYIGSASFDGSWRLWDVATQAELLMQEGHSKEVFTLQFQDDGALAASGGLDGIGRVWDLRTGRTAMVLDRHVQGIFSVDFSPNGYQIATGSADDTIRIWDMRSLKALHTIPAHKSTVSDIKFFRRAAESAYTFHPQGQEKPGVKDVEMESAETPESPTSTPKPGDSAPAPAVTYHEEDNRFISGLYFTSAGYDGVVKIWSADDWQLVKALATDAGKVMSVDISSDGRHIASGSYNRSFQLFANDT